MSGASSCVKLSKLPTPVAPRARLRWQWCISMMLRSEIWDLWEYEQPKAANDSSTLKSRVLFEAWENASKCHLLIPFKLLIIKLKSWGVRLCKIILRLAVRIFLIPQALRPHRGHHVTTSSKSPTPHPQPSGSTHHVPSSCHTSQTWPFNSKSNQLKT